MQKRGKKKLVNCNSYYGKENGDILSESDFTAGLIPRNTIEVVTSSNINNITIQTIF
jgi:hypothetical protein